MNSIRCSRPCPPRLGPTGVSIVDALGDRNRGRALASVVVPHSFVDTVTLQVMTDVAQVEAVVHHRDLRAAISSGGAPVAATAYAAALLARVPNPGAFADVATGRADPSTVLPVMR